MKIDDASTRFILALTIPTVFVLVLVGATLRDRVLPDVVSGGLIAILGSLVALFTSRYAKRDDKSGDDEAED